MVFLTFRFFVGVSKPSMLLPWYRQTYVLALAQYLLYLRRGIRDHLFGSYLSEKAVILVASVWAMLPKGHLVSKVTADTVKGHRNSNGLSAHDQSIAIDDTLVDPAEVALSSAINTLVTCRVKAGHDRVRASDFQSGLRRTLRVNGEVRQGNWQRRKRKSREWQDWKRLSHVGRLHCVDDMSWCVRTDRKLSQRIRVGHNVGDERSLLSMDDGRGSCDGVFRPAKGKMNTSEDQFNQESPRGLVMRRRWASVVEGC